MRRRGFVLPLGVVLSFVLMFLAMVLSGVAHQRLREATRAVEMERLQAAADGALVLGLQSLSADATYAGQSSAVTMGSGPETFKIAILKPPSSVPGAGTIPANCLYVLATASRAGLPDRTAGALVSPGGSSGLNSLPGVFASSLVLTGSSDIDSYQSSTGKFKRGTSAVVVTNSEAAGAIQLIGSSKIAGSVYLGPKGTLETGKNSYTMNSAFTIWRDWSTSYNTSELQTTRRVMPDVVLPMQPGSTSVTLNSQSSGLSPGAYKNATISNGARIELKKGVYVFDNLTLSGGARLGVADEGPVQIYVKSSFVLDNGVKVSDTDVPPSALQLYMAPGSSYTQSGGTDITAVIYGPKTDFNLSNSAEVFGSLIGNKVTLSGSAAVHHDVDLNDFTLPVDGGSSSGNLQVLFRQRN